MFAGYVHVFTFPRATCYVLAILELFELYLAQVEYSLIHLTPIPQLHFV
jgi:hypothetical protein